MKIFISADMEGTAGIADWDEVNRGHPDYAEFRALATAEVVAACEGAHAAGADEVVIKDAHDSGRNLILDRLPAYARIIRGWSGHPDAMMFGLSAEFAAALYIGYHSKAGTESNPLAHTTTTRISRLLINGAVVSELTLNAYCAARYGVPSVFVAGDAGLCADAREMVPGIVTVETLEGMGRATHSIAPARAQALIREGVATALSSDASALVPQSPEHYALAVEFCTPADAYRSFWYPGARASGPRTVSFESTDFFEIQRALRFLLA